jgi:hypothetical protein
MPLVAAPVEVPRREAVPARAPAGSPRPPVLPPRGPRPAMEAYRPGDDDQYDIPAFLRLRGGPQKGMPE